MSCSPPASPNGGRWPATRVHGQGGHVAFTGDGRLLETHGEHTEQWGEVTDWVPGERLSMTWHPGGTPARAGRVTVSFSPYGEQTSWSSSTRAGRSMTTRPPRDEYSGGWPTVLARYAENRGADEPAEPAQATWVALMHSPGPTAPAGSLFEDSRFAGHVAFLNQMQEAGYLVAAGPMVGQEGSGMTILRLPGDARMDEAQELAESDAAVTSGLLAVSVRPWRVMFAPGVTG